MQQLDAADHRGVIVVLSDQSAKYMVRKWRKARLSGGEHVLGYPHTNVLDPTHGVGTARRAEDLGLTDAQKVQAVVERMHQRMRESFEAWELGLIRGDNARKLPQAARALVLGLSFEAYRSRHRRAFDFVREHVEP